jgi:hypothetical protein
MANAITCNTFCNRLNKCFYYLEKDNYIKYINIFFNKLLIKFADANVSFINLFSSKLSSSSYTGSKFVYSNDREEYKTLCIQCAININKFLTKYPLTNILDTVKYKDKIKCSIGGIVQDRPINVHFCFRSLQEMQKDIDNYTLTNYIYNITKGLSNDCLIFNVQSDMYMYIKNKDLYYNIRRGYLKSIINSRNRKQGEYCLTCKNSCKPKFINKLNRLVNII